MFKIENPQEIDDAPAYYKASSRVQFHPVTALKHFKTSLGWGEANRQIPRQSSNCPIPLNGGTAPFLSGVSPIFPLLMCHDLLVSATNLEKYL